MAQLEFVNYNEKNVEVLAISGDIISMNIGRLNDYLNPLINQITKSRNTSALVLDLKEVSILDSSGIGLFCGKLVRLKKAHKKMGLCNLNKQLLDTLAISGLAQAFTIYNSIPEALSILGT